MPVFVEIVTDAFEENLRNQGDNAIRATGRAGARVARRPTRGIEIKEDTYAALKVILSDGSELELVDSSSPSGYSSTGYTNFILQSVQEVRMEKHQIVETFGASYIFFFGENPRFLDFSATIINSHDFNWEAEWWENYNANFRGTKLVEKGGRLYMFYDDTIVEGYMVFSQAAKVADQPYLINMSFRLFLTNYRNISHLDSPDFPIREGVIITEAVDIPNHALGVARDQALLDAEPDRSGTFLDAVDTSSIASGPRLSELLRDASRTGSISPRTAALIGTALPRRTTPIRSTYADNIDEYVGLSVNQPFHVAPGQSGFISPEDQARLEVDDLHQESIEQLEEAGADIDNPKALSDLGAMPNFESDARSPPTFRPQEKETGSFDDGSEQTEEDAVNPVQGFLQDPLGAVFGESVKGLNGSDSGTLPFGLGNYGYSSDFAKGPGFGQTGYGELGGPGFGGAVGAGGDPGFKDPGKFSFSGVVKKKAAFTKFLKPKSTQNVFGAGKGLGSSSSGATGGASVPVQGKPSPFSLISIPGVLEVGGETNIQ